MGMGEGLKQKIDAVLSAGKAEEKKDMDQPELINRLIQLKVAEGLLKVTKELVVRANAPSIDHNKRMVLLEIAGAIADVAKSYE